MIDNPAVRFRRPERPPRRRWLAGPARLALTAGLLVSFAAGHAQGPPPSQTQSGQSSTAQPPAQLTNGLSDSTPATAKQLTTMHQGLTLLQQRDDRLVAQLPNRMIVIAQQVPTAPVVSTQVWVKTGSIYEQQHVGAGLSHYLEHLLSGGTTTNRTEAESNAILGRIGAQTNAATSLDTVRYYINTTAEHAPTAIDLLSDWMQNSKITEAEFKREREVILREFSMGQGDPGRIFWKLTQKARYTKHPARHPTIGYVDRFKEITRQELIDFYHRMYVPNNMVFVVTGDIEPTRMVHEVTRRWKDEPTGELPEITFPKESGIDSPRTVEGRADIDRPRVRLAWPGTTLAGEHDYALDLLSVILGQGESSRLKQTVRDKQGLVSSIDAYNASFHWGEGFFGVDANVAEFPIRAQLDGVTPTEYRIGRVKQAVLNEIEKIRAQGITQSELERAKRMLIADVVKSNQGVQSIGSRMARDTIGMADPDYLAAYADRLKAITAGELQTAAETLLTEERLITVKLLPATDDQPVTDMTSPEVDAENKGADGANEAKQAKANAGADLAEAPNERTVTLDNTRLLDALKRNLNDQAGAERTFEVGEPKQYELDNGLRLIVQRSTVVPAVSMHLYWLGGLLGEEPGKEGVANATARMMMRGTQNYSADELASAVENLGANLSASAGNNTTYVQAGSLKADWQRVMSLMAEVTLKPTFPEDEWQTMKPRILAAIQRENDSWAGELQNDFRATYFEDHPWSQSPRGRASVVKGLTASDLAKHHNRHLAAGRAVLSVVGDVKPERVKAQVEALFSGMPTQAEAGFNPKDPAMPSPKLVQQTTDKPVAAAQVGFGPGLKRNSAHYPAMRVLSNVLSDFPGGWLEQQLRGQEGLAYAVGAYVQTGMVPGYFTVLFNSSPKATPTALRRVMNTIDRVKDEPIPQDELKRAKAKTLTSEFLGRQTNSQRATNMALDALYGVQDPQGAKFIESVKSLDAKAVNEVANQYLHNPVAVVLTSQQIDRATLEAAMNGKGPPEPADTQPAATQPAGDDS